MKDKKFIILFILTYIIACFVISACTSSHLNLVKNGTVTIERVSSEGCYISKVNAIEDDGVLVIGGSVKRRNFSGGSKGHIDIAIIDSEGKILKELSTLYTPQYIPAKRIHTREARFKVRLPNIPYKGSKIRVAYHRNLRSYSKTFDCGKNMAAIKNPAARCGASNLIP
jgi:hypothetical protein